MTNYKCEDPSLCEKFQAAICLHCNHRLCVQHIIEHDQIVFNDVKKLSNVTEDIFQQIKDKSGKNRIACDDLLPQLDEWRVQQLEKLEQVYENELLLIRNEGEALEDFHRDLLEQIEHDGRQPLERVQRQQNINTEVLNYIRQTIEKIRKESTQLKWDFRTPSVNAEYSLSNFTPIPVSLQMSLTVIGDIKLTETKKPTNKQSPSLRSSISSTNDVVKLRKGHPLKRLVKMFSDISSIKQSKCEIDIYIRNQKTHFKLVILVSCYLTAWHKQLGASEKNYLLNEHISTIQKYLRNRISDFDVLIGIQAFFNNNSVHDKKSNMMTFLLQFFLHHRCVTQNLILDWYKNNDEHGYMGFEEAKQLVEPFIQSLSTVDTDKGATTANDIEAIST